MSSLGEKEEKLIELNVAVLGKTGCGKSTFINSCCRLPPGTEHTAKTDVIECTSELTPYPRDNGIYRISEAELDFCADVGARYKVIFWDCPGFGTRKFPNEKYLELINAESFDFYLLLSCTRILEFELSIQNFIVQQGKTYFYVRTKIDRDIKNDRRSHPRTSTEKNVKSSIQKSIRDHIGSEPNLFFVNCKDPSAHDFPQLESLLVSFAASSKRSYKKFKTSTNPRAFKAWKNGKK